MVDKQVLDGLRKSKQDMAYYTACAQSAQAQYNMTIAGIIRDKGEDIHSTIVCLECGETRPINPAAKTQPPCECQVVK